MKKASAFALIALLSIVVSACGAAALPAREAEQAAPSTGFVEDEAVGMPAEEPMAEMESDVAAGRANLPSASERLVIRNANLSVVVEDPAQSVTAISRMAERMDGFVVSSNVFQTSFGESRMGEAVTAKQASITIRVPSERLDEALEEIKAGAVEVRSENVSGQDVTEEFTDLESRLRNLEAAEEQLREIMEESRRAEDTLRIFEELRRIREEIELVRGRMQFLQESARLSSISVELIPDVAAQPLQIGRWTPQGTAREAVEALIRALQTIADAAIWGLICVVPVALLFGVPGYFVGRAVLRRRAADEGDSGNDEGAASENG